MIKTKLNTGRLKFCTFKMLVVAFFCSLLFIPTSAFAVDYYVSGQVFQISPEDAADSIADNALTGEPWPFLHISIYDQNSGELLGESDAGMNGQFTVRFSLSFGPPGPDIECRVYKVVDGESELIPPAREGINFFSSISWFQGVGLKVVSDEIIAYGDEGFRNYPGVGIVFTRVGKVEIPYISQDTTLSTAGNRAMAGLADFTIVTGGIARADELHVAPFKQAPFAKGLLIFGDFGKPGGACTDDEIHWYQVKIRKIHETSDPISYDPEIIWMDPMSKTKTEVITWPMVQVNATTEKIGPYDGVEDDPLTLPVETEPISGLFWVNRNQVGGMINLFYSFPDLRVNWVSNSFNGLYEISLLYFKEVGRTPDDKPIVQEIPMTCFVGSPPPDEADDVALHKLILRVNNQALHVHFDHIYLKNESTGKYFAGEGNPDVSSSASAYDFNDEGLCNIMNLLNTYEVEIHFTAHHDGQYMHNYSLWAISNDRVVTVDFDEDSFSTHTTSTNPLWEGTPPGGTFELNKDDFTKDCAYIFHLHGESRLQDGYHYKQGRYPYRAYYVKQ